MPVRIGTSSVLKLPNALTVVNPSFSHDIAVGTELLLLSIGTQAAHSITVIPRLNGVDFELIHQTTPSLNNTDVT